MAFKTLHIEPEAHKKLRQYLAKEELKTFSDGILKLLNNKEAQLK